ncbi:glycosyl transferase [Flavobacteriaceae bacterium CRH]|nr:glycosyl transferase [Flavobacteriaceae bacterium CRH]
MKFVIITHVSHCQYDGQYFGYAPYVREINIWLEYVDELIVVGSSQKKSPTAIDIPYKHNAIDFRKIPDINFTNFKNNIISIFKSPIIFWKIFKAMKNADHIHLRCPGNIGLLGCLVQILFPNKNKTAKYAGNWDPNSKQPFSYRLQKRILNNTFLTRNMQVLVYGSWENQSKNIKSFFTATYSETEKENVLKSDLSATIEFIFVGSLVTGKNPLYAIQLIQKLIENGRNVILNLYGDGVEKNTLEAYIKENDLEKHVFLRGNQNQDVIKTAYQKSHFVILPSKSEGWPKAIAEGMFWECVPVATKVSCVPFMLDFGNRGILIEMNLENDSVQIEKILNEENAFATKSKLAAKWSQTYTTEFFEDEIKKLL